EAGHGHRDLLDERLEAGCRSDRQSLALVQAGRVGEERRGVAVGGEAEADEVERLPRAPPPRAHAPRSRASPRSSASYAAAASLAGRLVAMACTVGWTMIRSRSASRTSSWLDSG